MRIKQAVELLQTKNNEILVKRWFLNSKLKIQEDKKVKSMKNYLNISR